MDFQVSRAEKGNEASRGQAELTASRASKDFLVHLVITGFLALQANLGQMEYLVSMAKLESQAPKASPVMQGSPEDREGRALPVLRDR